MINSPVVCSGNMNFTEIKAVCTELVTQVLVMDALVFCLLGCMNACVQKTMSQVVFTTGIAGCHTIDCVFSPDLYIYCYQD